MGRKKKIDPREHHELILTNPDISYENKQKLKPLIEKMTEMVEVLYALPDNVDDPEVQNKKLDLVIELDRVAQEINKTAVVENRTQRIHLRITPTLEKDLTFLMAFEGETKNITEFILTILCNYRDSAFTYEDVYSHVKALRNLKSNK